MHDCHTWLRSAVSCNVLPQCGQQYGLLTTPIHTRHGQARAPRGNLQGLPLCNKLSEEDLHTLWLGRYRLDVSQLLRARGTAGLANSVSQSYSFERTNAAASLLRGPVMAEGQDEDVKRLLQLYDAAGGQADGDAELQSLFDKITEAKQTMQHGSAPTEGHNADHDIVYPSPECASRER